MVFESVHTGSESLVETLDANGITHVFGIPGEHCLGIVDAIGRHERMQFVSVRHESSAALMAEAYGKLTGSPAVCLGSASVGGSNLMAGINVADHDSTPMVAIVGQIATDLSGRQAWQDMDLVSVFGPLCRYAGEVSLKEKLSETTQRAITLARVGRPGPVFLSVPVDLQDGPGPVVEAAPAPLRAPAVGDEDLREIVDMIRRARRPLLVVGGGIRASGGRDDLIRFAKQVQLPVVTAFRRTDAFPNMSPNYVGALGLSASADVSEAVLGADLLLVIGTRLSEVTTSRYAFPTPTQRTVHIDVDGRILVNQKVPADMRVVADAGQALRGLLRECERAGIVKADVWWANYAHRKAGAPLPGVVGHTPVPLIEQVAAEIDTLLPDDGVVTSDAGDFFLGCAPHISFDGDRRFLGPTSGTMGYGLPAAIAAKLAEPHRVCVALCGDGGLMMSIQELETVVRYGIAVVVIVFNNSAYGSIVRHQSNRFGGHYVGTRLGDPHFAGLADLFGASGHLVTSASEFTPAFKDATAAECPTLIEVLV